MFFYNISEKRNNCIAVFFFPLLA
jgi:hypothetical protein